MKTIFILLTIFITGCTTTQLVSSWKNPDIESYAPNKVLVVGMTSNIEARQKFEQKIKTEFKLRGTEAIMSLELFDPSLKTEKMTKEELNTLEKDLINDGFDTVLFSKVIGIEDKVQYKQDYSDYDKTYRKFNEDYLKYQDILYNPEYYNEYTIYHAETAMYCICPTKDRELIWKGYLDIVDPKSIDETVTEYGNLVILVLEDLKLINPKESKENIAPEKLIN